MKCWRTASSGFPATSRHSCFPPVHPPAFRGPRHAFRVVRARRSRAVLVEQDAAYRVAAGRGASPLGLRIQAHAQNGT